MNENEASRQFGIKVSMPGGDTMTAEHLLGDNWESVRWFDSELERDEALKDMERQPPYYRRGDSPTVVLEKVEQ